MIRYERGSEFLNEPTLEERERERNWSMSLFTHHHHTTLTYICYVHVLFSKTH